MAFAATLKVLLNGRALRQKHLGETGTVGGRPTVTIRVNLPDGTLRLLKSAVQAFEEAHGVEPL